MNAIETIAKELAVNKWLAFLDDGRYGIINEANYIVFGLGFGLTKDTAKAIVYQHNAVIDNLLQMANRRIDL